jgi:hypothetical protein
MWIRTVLVAASLVLSAQANAVPAETDASDNEEYLATESLESCVKRWDRATHMTREAWRATCQRVSEERGSHLRKQGVASDRK